jgi:hypothetical protein
LDEEASLMTQANPFHYLAACAAFIFMGAIVLGAF